jgi:1,2-diacylglycerol 3-beta-glucosyltransferase
MPANSWSETSVSREFEPLSSILFGTDDEIDAAETETDSTSYRGYAGRRRKAAIVLTAVWSGTILLHLVSWGTGLVLGLSSIVGVHLFRLLLTGRRTASAANAEVSLDVSSDNPPFVSILVAAKDEEAVIESLVDMLCHLDYPNYEVWAIDDNSTDNTPALLDRLALEHPNLKVLHRGAGAGGGKSGALNQALRRAKGDIIAVFDADARIAPDLLWRILPQFDRQQVGAVQLRKEITNPTVNFLTRGQAAEMALDAFFQQRRTGVNGIGELRGNGQFVRRKALESCGYFNEETITDDLDLTFRLHLDGWDIGCVFSPTVGEEGVTGTVALWHQRSRWAEGGYQRYLDYWRLIAQKRMSLSKKIDLFVFAIVQYLLPTVAMPDLLMALARNRLPIFGPLTGVTVALSFVGMFVGLRQMKARSGQPLPFWTALGTAISGTLYMMHWFAVIATTTVRMSVRRKQLKWVKTVHHG